MRVWFSALAITVLLSHGFNVARGDAWHDDYHCAVDQAEAQGKMALFWFCDPRLLAENNAFESDGFENEVLQQPEIAGLIALGFVPARLPTSIEILSGGQKVRLLDHAAFAEMHHGPGLAIIDMTDKASPLHRQVVSVYPFRLAAITSEKLAVLLQLPRGTLT